MASAASIAATPKDQFKRAYRMVRTAIRGRDRQSLKLDLLVEPDYSADCRFCNAGAKVAGKVAAALGYADQITLGRNTQACLTALGQPARHQSNLPNRLAHEAWVEWRLWVVQLPKVA